MADTNPIDEPVDYIVLAGRPSPGLADVTGGSAALKWDECSGPGLSGAILRFRGRKLAHFQVRLRLMDQQDWADWHAWKPLVQRPPIGKFPKAQDIVHPWLQELDIKSAVVEEVTQPEEFDNMGYAVVIKFIEYRPITISLSKPVGSKQAPVTDPYDLMIQQKRAQLAAVEALGAK